MKTILNLPPTKYAIPDGEGFTALPIAFITGIAPAKADGVSMRNTSDNEAIQYMK